MVSVASSATLPTATMRPSQMPTSAWRAGAPVPSTSVPPRINVSIVTPCSLCLPLRGVPRGPPLLLGTDARTLRTRRRCAFGFLGLAALFALGLQLLVAELARRAEVACARRRLDLDWLADRKAL